MGWKVPQPKVNFPVLFLFLFACRALEAKVEFEQGGGEEPHKRLFLAPALGQSSPGMNFLHHWHVYGSALLDVGGEGRFPLSSTQVVSPSRIQNQESQCQPPG